MMWTCRRQRSGSAKGTVETSHLLTAFEILRSTNYTLVCPAYMARNDGATRDLVTLPILNNTVEQLNTRL